MSLISFILGVRQVHFLFIFHQTFGFEIVVSSYEIRREVREDLCTRHFLVSSGSIMQKCIHTFVMTVMLIQFTRLDQISRWIARDESC